MYNFKFRIRYDGKIRLKAICYTILFFEAIIFLIALDFISFRLWQIYCIIFCMLLSVIFIYNLSVYHTITKILKNYNLLSNKITKKIFEDNELNSTSVASIKIELNEIDKYAKFNKRLFSVYDMKLISNSKTKAHSYYELLLKNMNK